MKTIGSPLLKAPTGIFTKQHIEMNIETTILVAFKPAWPMPKEDEYNY